MIEFPDPVTFVTNNWQVPSKAYVDSVAGVGGNNPAYSTILTSLGNYSDVDVTHGLNISLSSLLIFVTGISKVTDASVPIQTGDLFKIDCANYNGTSAGVGYGCFF